MVKKELGRTEQQAAGELKESSNSFVVVVVDQSGIQTFPIGRQVLQREQSGELEKKCPEQVLH